MQVDPHWPSLTWLGKNNSLDVLTSSAGEEFTCLEQREESSNLNWDHPSLCLTGEVPWINWNKGKIQNSGSSFGRQPKHHCFFLWWSSNTSWNGEMAKQRQYLRPSPNDDCWEGVVPQKVPWAIDNAHSVTFAAVLWVLGVNWDFWICQRRKAITPLQ